MWLLITQAWTKLAIRLIFQSCRFVVYGAARKKKLITVCATHGSAKKKSPKHRLGLAGVLLVLFKFLVPSEYNIYNIDKLNIKRHY